MLDWHNGSLRVLGGRFISVRDDPSGLIAKIKEDGTVKDVLFKKTDNVNSNYERFKKTSQTLKQNDVICALVNDYQGTITVYSFIIWAGMIRHEKLVDENGEPLALIMGKLTKNVPQNTAVTGTDGEKHLRTSISMYHSGYEKGFWQIHFDGVKAVAVNGIYQNTEAIALVKNMSEIVKKPDNTEQKMEGVCLDII